MFVYSLVLACCWIAPTADAILAAQQPEAIRFDDVLLLDVHGHARTIEHGRALVVVFLSVDCPLANLYASRLAELARRFESRGVRFLAVDANPSDSPDDLLRFDASHPLGFPLYHDPQWMLADRLGARRVPEVFVLDEQNVVRYRGQIDDQFTTDGRKPAPLRHDLAECLDELTAGRTVSVPRTEATGCAIERRRPVAQTGTTYVSQIAAIVNKHCVSCHRPGQVAPFSLLDYDDVRSHAETIAEVLAEGRMPPWDADPRYGRFSNDLRLSDRDRDRFDAWIRAGCPRGEGEPPPAPLVSSGDWSIGQPDKVLKMPQTFVVPAAGTIEYQLFDLGSFDTDTWVAAAEVRPGNRAVVHHSTVYLQPPGSDSPTEAGTLGSFCLVATAPGNAALDLPKGMAKLVPAKWKLILLIHYAAIGSPQTDRTEVGLRILPRSAVRHEVATRLIVDEHLCIQPGEADHVVQHGWQLPSDAFLLSMFPHMHARGRSFRYEALYPDGEREILLDVPRYDVDWQNRYDLAKPLRLPAGTWIRCTAHYDNSADNSRNPDPWATVCTGPQSTDEMFNGYFDLASVEELPAEATLPRRTLQTLLMGAGMMLIGRALVGRRAPRACKPVATTH